MSGTAWKEFVSAALQPSAQALAITLAVPLILFGGCVIFITPQLMAGDASAYFSSGAWDDYTDLTADTLALSQAHDDTPIVMILGASDTRESIREHAAIAGRVFERTGIRPVIYNFTSSDQTLWEMAALIEQIGEQHEAVIVLGMGAGRLAIDNERLAEIVANPRLGFRSPAFDAEAVRAGLEPSDTTGNYFLDNAGFFLARMQQFIRNLVTRHPRHRRHNLYEGNPPAPESRWIEFEETIKQRAKRYAANADSNLDLLARILKKIDERQNQQAVILLPPKNPRDVADGLWQQLYLGNITRMQAFSAEHNVPFLMLDDAADIKYSDFYDASHVNNPDTQHRYRDLLSDNIAALFEQDGVKEISR